MSERVSLRLAETFGQAHPVAEDLYLAAFRGMAGERVRAEIELIPGRPGIRHLLVARDGAPTKVVAGMRLIEILPETRVPLIRHLHVTPVYEAGRGTTYRLRLEFYPRESYADSGLSTQPDALLLISSPILQWQTTSLSTWDGPALSDEERAYARRQWGPLVNATSGDLAQAQALSLRLALELADSNGVPSDALMAAPPFRQHELLVSGAARGYCENAAAIFVHACRAFGLRARPVWLHESVNDGPDLQVQICSAHLSTEVFDRQRNHWVWLDSRFHALAAYLGEEGPLSLAEFCLFLNQPARRPRLRLLIQQAQDAQPRLLPVADCPKQAFGCFEGWGKRLLYATPDSA